MFWAVVLQTDLHIEEKAVMGKKTCENVVDFVWTEGAQLQYRAAGCQISTLL